MRIGVFGSGVGGKAVANAIKRAFPDADVVLKEDKANLPYGNKTVDELYELVLPLLNELSNLSCDVIVVACNSVSTTILDRLKQQISTPLIGVEPLVEQACKLTKSGVVTVCATPLTLSSPRYAELKHNFSSHKTFLEPDCSQWAYLIENDNIDRLIIKNTIENVLDQGSDVIVLGCTHYHWIESDIREITGDKAVIIQPEQKIISDLAKALKPLG